MGDRPRCGATQGCDGQRFSGIWSKVNNVGVQAQTGSGGSTSQVYIVSSGGTSSSLHRLQWRPLRFEALSAGAIHDGRPDSADAAVLGTPLQHRQSKPDGLLLGSFAITAAARSFTAGRAAGLHSADDWFRSDERDGVCRRQFQRGRGGDGYGGSSTSAGISGAPPATTTTAHATRGTIAAIVSTTVAHPQATWRR